VRDGGSVDIEYDDFDLRPGEERELPPVPVLVHEETAHVIAANWLATAEDIRGRRTGEFSLTVTESTIDLDDLDKDKT
jgi:hypothetical protein